MKTLKHLLIGSALALSLVISGLAAGHASAQSSGSASGMVQCSLWAGSNFDLEGGLACNGTSSSSLPPVISSSKPATNNHSGRYAALGDSLAAGLGLPAASNATSQDKRCGRSPQAYPYQVANARQLTLIHQACSGAKAGDLFTKQRVSGPNPKAQLNAVFAQGTPELITISAGANDARWASFIRTCYATNCAKKSTTVAANALLISLQAKLYYLFYSIESRSGGVPPQVVVTGYYNPVSAACGNQQTRVTPEEIAWLTTETNALNKTLQDVSSHYAFVKFVPVNFTGHDICSATPWVQGVNDKAPFHPTAKGQQVIGQAVLNAIKNY